MTITMPGAIFISPHHDDVCFSMAATALACQGGQLINVFTQSDYASAPIPCPEESHERTRYITALRAREDQAFADACNLTRHDLKLEEPSLLGIHPFDLSGVQTEAERLGSILIDHVIRLRLARTRNKPALFCPMGIGGHRNHVSVLVAVVHALPGLRKLFDIHFYEDLHYASRVDYRNAGLLRFLNLLKGERLSRSVLALTPELFAQKMSFVGMYFSQHADTPRASDFIPAATGDPGPHEAVWTLSPLTSGTLAAGRKPAWY